MKKFLKSLGLSFLGLVLAFSSACSSGTTSSGDKDSATIPGLRPGFGIFFGKEAGGEDFYLWDTCTDERKMI